MTKYIVIELQTSDTGIVATIVTTHDTYLEAQQKYHLVLSSAAVSAVYMHGASILTNDGVLQEYKVYTHIPEPTPNVEE